MKIFDSLSKTKKVKHPEGRRDKDHLLKLIHDKNFNVRCNAIIALGKERNPRAIKPLIDLLKEDSSFVREKASKTLVRLGKPAIEPLIQSLKDHRINNRSALVLKSYWKNAVEPLINALKSDERNIRLWAAKVLGWIKDPRAVEPLITALEDKDKEVQENVVEALSATRDPGVVEPLISFLLTCEENNLQLLTVKTLGELRDQRAVDPIITVLSSRSLEGIAYIERKNKFKKALKKLGLDNSTIEEKIKIKEWQLFSYDLRQEMSRLPMKPLQEIAQLATGHNNMGAFTTKDEAYDEVLNFLEEVRKGATDFSNPRVHSIPEQSPLLKVEFFRYEGSVEYSDGIVVGRTGKNEYTLLRKVK
jgi:HEAT repeat protein